MEEEEDDPVVEEIPIYLSYGLKDKLYVCQYPLKGEEKYECNNIIKSKVRPQNKEIHMEFGLDCHSANYDHSKAEQIALNADGSHGKRQKIDKKDEERFFPRNVMDKYILTSSKAPLNKSNYAVGLYHNKEIHLTPVTTVLQMRPNFAYLDKSDKRAKEDAKQSGEVNSEEEEEEEGAQLVTVKFSSKQTERAKQAREKSFGFMAKKRGEEKWYNTQYHDALSQESELAKGFMYCEKTEEKVSEICEDSNDYLQKLVSDMDLDDPYRSATDLGLKSLKALPLADQVKTVLQNVILLRFSQLMDMFTGEKPGDVLKILQQLAVLVQGNWVIRSEHIYPKDSKCGSNGVPTELMCRGRDYILYLFTQRRYLDRISVTRVTKLPTDEVKEILLQVSRLKKRKGWEFILPMDKEFISRNPEIVQRQIIWWEAKHKQLSETFIMKSPSTTRRKSTRDSSVSSSDGELRPSTSGGRRRQKSRNSESRSSDCDSGAENLKRTIRNFEEPHGSVKNVLIKSEPMYVEDG